MDKQDKASVKLPKALPKKTKVTLKKVKNVVKKVKVASETVLDWSSLEYLSDCD
jgi:hypothetical protein